jgi:hypothetical protein
MMSRVVVKAKPDQGDHKIAYSIDISPVNIAVCRVWRRHLVPRASKGNDEWNEIKALQPVLVRH